MPITAATAPRELYVLGGTQLIGLPGGLGGAKSAEGDSAWPSPDSLETGYERGRLIKTIGHLRLRETSPEKILQQFHEARTGRLMCYYQLFWPIFIKGDEVMQRVLELKEFCDKQSRDKFPRWQRVVTLPAVAAIHALASSFRSEDIERLYELILNTLPTEELQASQGVLEILWQNMTAALIRHRYNWEPNTEQKNGWFYIDDRLITRAVALCRASLVPEGRLLFRAALVAWQFLLTYERALLARGDKASAVQVKADRQEAAQGHGRDFVGRVVWLKEFENVYEPLHRYEDMLPQLTELEMGRHRLPDATAVRLATLAHLQAIYDTHLIAEGKLHSDYMDAQSAAETAAKSFRFFADFGGAPSAWPPLKQFAKQQRLLSRAALKYLESLFIEYEKTAGQWESEVDREWLAKWVPFREWDEGEVFYRMYHPRSRDELITLIVKASEEDGLIELWKGAATFGAQHGAKRRNLSVTPQVLSEIEEELLSLAPVYREEREFLQMGAHSYRGVNLDDKLSTCTVEVELCSSQDREQESIGEGIFPISEDALVVHGGVEIEASLGRGGQTVAYRKNSNELENQRQLWRRSFGSYRPEELRAITFPSREERKRAIHFILTDPHLKGMPMYSPDGRTFFVPIEAVTLLEDRSLTFSVSELLGPDDLLPGELAEMRRKYSM